MTFTPSQRESCCRAKYEQNRIAMKSREPPIPGWDERDQAFRDSYIEREWKTIEPIVSAYLKEAGDGWRTDMENAPRGGGAERVDDPNWVEPPRILLKFGEEAISVAHWDWYYAEGGRGCTDGFAWIEPCSGEPLNLHYSTPPTHWKSL